MSALELLTLAAQAVYLGVFLVVAWNTARRPSRAATNATFFFGALAFALLSGRVTALAGPIPVLTAVSSIFGLALPYLLLRLLADYAGVPAWIGAASGLAKTRPVPFRGFQGPCRRSATMP